MSDLWALEQQEWAVMEEASRNKISESQIRNWQDELLRRLNEEMQKEEQGNASSDGTKDHRRKQLTKLVSKMDVPSNMHKVLVEDIVTDMFHFGPVDELWAQKDTISDIQMLIPVDDTKQQIIMYKDRNGRQRFHGTGFRNYRHAFTWLNRHLSQVKDRYDSGDIEKNATFPTGERMHIISPSCAAYSWWHPKTNEYEFVPCLIITARRFLKPFTIFDLTNNSPGSATPPSFEDLKAVRQPYSRRPRYFPYTGGLADPATMEYSRLMANMCKTHFIFGETGAGKSSLQNAFTSVFPENKLLLCLEESNDSQPQCSGHVIRLKEVKGKFTLEDCMKATLRMYPDIIQLSEVRDKISYTFLRAIQSGHEGSSTTAHASSCKDGIEVMVNLAANHESRPSREEIRDAMYRNVHTAFHIEVKKRPGYHDDRFIDEVVQLLPNGTLHTVMRFKQEGVNHDGTLAGYFEFFGPTDDFVEEMFAAGFPIPQEWGWTTEEASV